MPYPDDLKKELEEEKLKANKFSFELAEFDKSDHAEDINKIVRSHLYLEHVLSEMLSEKFVIKGVVDLRRMGVVLQGNICIALGLMPASMKEVIFKINELRNKVAHRLDFRIDAKTSDEIWNCLPEDIKWALCPDREHEKVNPGIRYERMFYAVVLKIDIYRQQYLINELESKYAQAYLRRALDKRG